MRRDAALALAMPALAAALALGFANSQEAFASSVAISDQASCERIFGMWDEINSYCMITSRVINNGDTFGVASGVTLIVKDPIINFGTIYNNGKIQNIGSGITNFGTIHNSLDSQILTGDFVNSGTIYNSGSISSQRKLNNDGSLGSHSIFNNSGTINIDLEGTLDSFDRGFNHYFIENSGYFYTQDAFENFGTINNYGTFSNGAFTTNNGTINIDLDSILYNEGTIDNNRFINNNGTINNDRGTIYNNEGGNIVNDLESLFYNNEGGTIYNYGGTITNEGTIENNFGTLITDNDSGTINNFGIIINNNGAIQNNSTFINSGSIENNCCIIENDEGGTIENNLNSFIYNNEGGIIDNEGTVPNLGTINNDGTINNNGAINNFDTFTNYGIINNFDTITNEGTLENDCAGVINGAIPLGNAVKSICDHDNYNTLPESHFEDNPLDRVGVDSLAFLDATGIPTSQAGVGQQVDIAATMTNHQQEEQECAFIVQVTDEEGSAVHVSWQQGIVASGQTAVVSTAWTPTEDGSYTVQMFVWNGLGMSPTPLSTVTVDNIEVTE